MPGRRAGIVTLISRKSDYATRILLHLAALPPGSWSTARQIASQRFIPPRLVGQIIGILAKAELVITKRGKGGGIRMARPGSQISLLDVVETMQGPLSLNSCTIQPDWCRLAGSCPMHGVWARCEEGLAEGLRRETLDRLASRDSGGAIA